jgi:hypothetical protein
MITPFLASPSTHDGAAVERVESVTYDYLDFSTVERRRTMCEAEVQINRRTARASVAARRQSRASRPDHGGSPRSISKTASFGSNHSRRSQSRLKTSLPMLLQAIAISRLTVQLVQIMRARLDLA